MKRIIYIMTLLLLLAGPVYAKAADEPTPIYDLEGLLSMAQNPAGSYILMDDIDLAGVAWDPIDFTGSFDGNGHCLLNLTVTSLTKETRKVIDGNRKPYQAKFAGFFGIIEEATVKNLTILGANVSFEYDDNAFLGILCGYTLNSTIENCHVQGFVSLTTSTIMYGVAGLCGYGTNYYKGCIKGCSADVRLVTIDTDLKTKDEQFLAGIVCIGYSKIWDCTVKIDGYISDHGYVHSGGITGMFIKDTDEQVIQGSITGNKVTGRIRFFEDNTNRRAYCGGIIGEKFTRVAEMKDNDDSGFVRDEIFTYDKNIMPHDTCLNPAVTKEVVPATRSEFGYTLESCSSCGFQTKSDFTIYVEPPTATPTPLPTATPEPTFTPTPTVAPTSTPLPTQAVEAKDKNSTGGVIAVCLLAASAVVILTFFIRSRKTSK